MDDVLDQIAENMCQPGRNRMIFVTYRDYKAITVLSEEEGDPKDESED